MDMINSLPAEILQQIWRHVQIDVNHVPDETDYGRVEPYKGEPKDVDLSDLPEDQQFHRENSCADDSLTHEGRSPWQLKTKAEHDRRWQTWNMYWEIPALRQQINEHYRTWLRNARFWIYIYGRTVDGEWRGSELYKWRTMHFTRSEGPSGDELAIFQELCDCGGEEYFPADTDPSTKDVRQRPAPVIIVLANFDAESSAIGEC